jgi:hypothetical protein
LRAYPVLAGIVVLCCSTAASAEIGDEDDPKCARGECRPPSPFYVDEDDPKLARGYRRRWPTAHFELNYRYLAAADPYGGSLPFHLVQFTGYPVSRYLRVGLQITGGAAPRESAWLADLGISLGAQYPWRISPFFDVAFAIGLVGATIADHRVVSYEYRPTIEAGIDVFVARSFHLTIAVGWSHPIYGGVDANAIELAVKNHETPNYDVHAIGYDTVTVRTGFGF